MDVDEENPSIRDSIVGLLESVHRFRRALLSRIHDPIQIYAIVDQFRSYRQCLYRLLDTRVPRIQWKAKGLFNLMKIIDYNHNNPD